MCNVHFDGTQKMKLLLLESSHCQIDQGQKNFHTRFFILGEEFHPAIPSSQKSSCPVILSSQSHSMLQTYPLSEVVSLKVFSTSSVCPKKKTSSELSDYAKSTWTYLFFGKGRQSSQLSFKKYCLLRWYLSFFTFNSDTNRLNFLTPWFCPKNACIPFGLQKYQNLKFEFGNEKYGP